MKENYEKKLSNSFNAIVKGLTKYFQMKTVSFYYLFALIFLLLLLNLKSQLIKLQLPIHIKKQCLHWYK